MASINKLNAFLFCMWQNNQTRGISPPWRCKKIFKRLTREFKTIGFATMKNLDLIFEVRNELISVIAFRAADFFVVA